MADINIPLFSEFRYSNSSKIFESEEIKGMTPDQILEAEKAYHDIIEKLEKGEELDEGFLSKLAGGAAGALFGPAIGRAICKALGIDEKGTFGKLLTSRLVTTAIGAALPK